VNETCIIVNIDNNGYLSPKYPLLTISIIIQVLQYMALKMTLIEGKGEFNTGGAKKFSHNAIYNLKNN